MRKRVHVLLGIHAIPPIDQQVPSAETGVQQGTEQTEHSVPQNDVATVAIPSEPPIPVATAQWVELTHQ